MALLDILHYPDPRLHNKAKAVERVDDKVRTLIDDMLETMYAAPGIGLAAIQVNVPLRVITIDLSDERNDPLCLVNPKILERRGTVELEEGCLSVPGLSWNIVRPKEIHIVAFDLDGNEVSIEADELESRLYQHELDHLDGTLLFEYLDDDQVREAKRILRERAMGQVDPSPGLSLP